MCACVRVCAWVCVCVGVRVCVCVGGATRTLASFSRGREKEAIVYIDHTNIIIRILTFPTRPFF